jgi:hypothetical protein
MKIKAKYSFETQVQIILALKDSARVIEETIAELHANAARYGNPEFVELYVPAWQERLASVQAALAEFNDAKIDA